MLKQILGIYGLCESQETSPESVATRYRITTSKRNIIFVPVSLQDTDITRERDLVREYCESKTGLKFSIDMSYEGAGIALVVDMYSILDKLKVK
jgi:hypothetical protein